MTARMAATGIVMAVLTVHCGTKQPAKITTPEESGGEGVEVADEEAPEPHVVDVQLYVMSGCPYAADIVPPMHETQEKLGDLMSYTQYHVLSMGVDGEMKCLHGEAACQADMLQMCAQELAPEKILALSTCMFEVDKALGGNFDACAAQVGVDAPAVHDCAEGELGQKLLEANVDNLVANGVKGSPTVFIDGKSYKGGRNTEALVTAVCLALPEDQRPADCPEVKTVHVTVISDERCLECEKRASGLIEQFQTMFMDLQVEQLDWSEDEARQMMQKMGIELLPAYVFHADVVEDPGYLMLQNHVMEKDGYHVVDPAKVHSSFDPTREICDNGIDDTGDGVVDCKDSWCATQKVCAEVCDNGVDDTDNGLVDCDDPECTDKILCREEAPAKLDMFIMSHCPYAMKALKAIPEVLERLGDLQFQIHYITSVMDEQGYQDFKRKVWCKKYDNDKWYCSMHGEEETEENMRYLCAADISPGKYMDFITCRNDDPGNEDWESCAADAKIPLKKMRKCMNTDDKLTLLEKDAAIGKSMEIHASPSYLINNKHLEKISPSADRIIEAVCQYNETLPGCQDLEDPEPVSVSADCSATAS